VSADLFFLSSREDPFPTVVHEAMAAGLPIVGFKNAGGAAEYILRTGGRLVNYQQTHEAVQTIIEMLNIHSDELEKIRRNGKEIVTEELSYMNYYQSIVALLNKNQVISALT
jgi:glycosyltransferase involved in cell wall biosynthesis